MVHKYRLPLGLLLLAACFFVAYFLKRTDTTALLAVTGLVSVLYALLIWRPVHPRDYSYFLGLSVVLRLVFLCAFPALSDDVYRFLWDGHLLESGIHPYAYLPEELMRDRLAGWLTFEELFPHLNSPRYYSLYPPVLQLIFFLSVKCSFGIPMMAMVNLRLFVLAAELGTFFFLARILQLLHIDRNRIFIYAFNPLIIIELTGNLHMEAVMIFFLSAAIYFLLLWRIGWSAVCFALAVSSKVIPLILLPLIIRRMGLRSGILFAGLVALVCIALLLPFVDHGLLSHLADSFGLYFQQFEFNASVYYLLKWLECRLTGQETIRVTSLLLPMLSMSVVLWLSLRTRRNDSWRIVLASALSILCTYYVCSPVVHPWYLAFAVMLSVFAPFRYALVWSMLAFLSYAHYAVFPYREPVVLLWIEYLAVAAVMLWEYRRSVGDLERVRDFFT